MIESLAASFSGTWEPGENPPDAYLTCAGGRVAIEISTLTQHVTDERGTRSRITDDHATTVFANALDAELGDLVPEGHTIGLVLSSPIRQHRKTRAKLAQIIRECIADPSMLQNERKIQINGNDITIFLNQHGLSDHKKVSAVFTHRSSDPDILANVMQILEERVTHKAKKCLPLAKEQTVWLALLNDYWLTDADTYRFALSRMSLNHPFHKIVLVNGNGSVDILQDQKCPR